MNVQHTVLHRHRDHHSKDTSRCVIHLATGILVLKEKRIEKLLPSFSFLANLAVHSLLIAHRCTTRSRSQHKSKWMAKSNTFPQYMKRKEWGQEQWRRPFLEEDDHPPTRAKLKKKITGIDREVQKSGICAETSVVQAARRLERWPVLVTHRVKAATTNGAASSKCKLHDLTPSTRGNRTFSKRERFTPLQRS